MRASEQADQAGQRVAGDCRTVSQQLTIGQIAEDAQRRLRKSRSVGARRPKAAVEVELPMVSRLPRKSRSLSCRGWLDARGSEMTADGPIRRSCSVNGRRCRPDADGLPAPAVEGIARRAGRVSVRLSEEAVSSLAPARDLRSRTIRYCNSCCVGASSDSPQATGIPATNPTMRSPMDATVRVM